MNAKRNRQRVRIYRGERASRGARTLSRETGIRLVRTRNSRYQARRSDLIINWGCSTPLDSLHDAKWLNEPEAVGQAINKRSAFAILESAGVDIPSWCTDRASAAAWFADENAPRSTKVVERHRLCGSQGAGIRIAESAEELTDAPLYTRYFQGYDEYRIHVCDGQVFDTQKKRKRRGVDGISNEVRNRANGWVYCREGIEAPPAAYEAAIETVRALGLTFGAVDIKSRRDGRSVVLECNCAPGLHGQTLVSYGLALHRAVESR